MMYKKICKRWFSIQKLVVFVTFLLVLTHTANAQQRTYTWGSGVKGASWYPVAATIKTQLPFVNLRLQTSGGVSNAVLVGSKRIDFGFVQDFNMVMAQKGEPPFRQAFNNLRVLFTFMVGYAQYVVRADSDIKRIEDLAGVRVNIVDRGFSTNLANEIILKAAGILNRVKPAYLSYADGAQEFVDGHLDALLYPAIAPNASIQNAARSVPIRLLEFDEVLVEKIRKLNPVFEAANLKKGTYPSMDRPIKTLLTRHVVFTRADMDETLVYRIVKTVFAKKKRIEKAHVGLSEINLKQMSAPISGLAFHPGALRFFKESGLR